MGESAACLVRSFTRPSPTSEEKKMNHLHRALTTSVSFGRFMSESLDWVKWSAFTQNRYMEEVEKYSKPGSVAEKKAYFEAHFKRRRAAALLEQQNAVSDATATDPFKENAENKVKDDDGSSDLNLTQRDSSVVQKNTEKEEEEVQNGCTANLVSQSVTSAEVLVKNTQPGGVEISTDAQAFVESQVGQTNRLENNDKSEQEDQDCEKDDSSKGNSALLSEVSSVFLINDHASKCLTSPPARLILPVQLKNGEKTPNNNDNMKDSGNKRRSYTTSLQVPISLASCLGQTQKAMTPVQPKIASSSVHRGPAKKFKNSARPQTKTTEEAANGIFKRHLTTTTQQESRTETIAGNSLLRSRILDGKLQSSSMKCSKSSTAFEIKARLPTVACPFTFKSEERAAKRKEKLEQKLKSNVTEKQRPFAAKPQIKTRNSIKQVHNSIATEATKNSEISIPLSTGLSNNNMKKSIPTLRPRNPKAEERASFKVLDDDLRPLCCGKVMGESNDANVVKNKQRATTISRVWKRNMNENASPNIQL